MVLKKMVARAGEFYDSMRIMRPLMIKSEIGSIAR